MCLISSTNSTLKSVNVTGNNLCEAAEKAIALEIVLCQMRNPEVTSIYAARKGFRDEDAIKIGEALR